MGWTKPLFAPPSRFASNRPYSKGSPWISRRWRTSYFSSLSSGGKTYATLEDRWGGIAFRRNAAARGCAKFRIGSGGGPRRDSGKGGDGDAPPILAIGGD